MSDAFRQTAGETSCSNKKILVIMGSPRKGNTFLACEILRKKIEINIECEFEYIWLRDMKLLPCKGCLLCCCAGEEKCPNHDDASLILEKMRTADGVLFAVPVYVMNVPGVMKVFLERFGYLGHRQRFFDKKAVILVNTASGGLGSVMKYMDRIISVWGFEVVSKTGFLAPPDPATNNPSALNIGAIDRVLSRTADLLCKSFSSRRKSPALYETAFFHVWRSIAPLLQKYYPVDHRYWQQKGWFEPGKKFFVEVPVNPIFVMIGKIYGWLALKAHKKNMRSADMLN